MEAMPLDNRDEADAIGDVFQLGTSSWSGATASSAASAPTPSRTAGPVAPPK